MKEEFSMVGSRDTARQREAKARAARAQSSVRRPPPHRGKHRNPRKYAQKRQLVTALYYAAISAVILCCAIILIFTVFFKVEQIDVIPNEDIPYSAEEILLHCPIVKGDNLLLAGLDDAAYQITSALPYIDKCKITRGYPSTLRIEPVPAEILGYIRIPGDLCIVISTGGRAIAVVSDEELPNLTAIYGLTAETAAIGQPVDFERPEDLETGAQITRILAKYSLKASSITFEDPQMTFVYDNRLICKLGLPINIEKKVTAICEIITRGYISPYEKGVVDARNSDKISFIPDYS